MCRAPPSLAKEVNRVGNIHKQSKKGNANLSPMIYKTTLITTLSLISSSWSCERKEPGRSQIVRVGWTGVCLACWINTWFSASFLRSQAHETVIFSVMAPAAESDEKARQEATVLMQRLSYPTETVLSNEITSHIFQKQSWKTIKTAT